MDNPERRKKLEEIKRRRQELQNQLNASKAKKEMTGDNAKSIDEIAKEVLSQAKVINPNESQGMVDTSNNFMNNLIKNNFIKNLATVHISETFPPSVHEVYDESTQYVDETKESDSEEDVNENQIAKPRMQLIVRKNKVYNSTGEIEEQYDFKQKEYNVLDEDDDEYEEFVNKKNDDEILDLCNNKKKTLERALNEKSVYDLFNNDFEDLYKDKALPESKNLLYESFDFFDDNCLKRTVTSLDWSMKHKELLLAGYSKGDEFLINQKSGLILLWSLALRKQPEFIFTCQPEITSAVFHSYNQKLILGGTVTGQVLIWDTRGKQSPIMKTVIGGSSSGDKNSKTNSSAISCLGVVGTTNSNHIVSVSDGIICIWSLSNLTKPVKIIELRKKRYDFGTEKTDLDEIGVLSMGLQQFETNSLLIGSDNSSIYQISLHSGNTDKTLDSNIVNEFKGHQGPIYSVEIHPDDYYNTCNFSHLFSSCSADWTTKIWSRQQDEPLLTLDYCDDFVYCSKWCPTKASVLVTGDGSGNLDVWDFNKDLEIPLVRCNLGKEVLNKLSWSSDGRRLAVGDSSGRIKLLKVSKDLYKSKPEDSIKFEKVVSRMKISK